MAGRDSNRPARVGAVMRDALNELLTRGKIKDPRVRPATISEVRVAKDLKNAKVYVQLITGTAQEKKETVEGLRKASAWIRRALRDALSLRSVPELTFTLDETAEKADKVMGLLAQIERDRRTAERGGADDSESDEEEDSDEDDE